MVTWLPPARSYSHLHVAQNTWPSSANWWANSTWWFPIKCSFTTTISLRPALRLSKILPEPKAETKLCHSCLIVNKVLCINNIFWIKEFSICLRAKKIIEDNFKSCSAVIRMYNYYNLIDNKLNVKLLYLHTTNKITRSNYYENNIIVKSFLDFLCTYIYKNWYFLDTKITAISCVLNCYFLCT